MALCQPAEIVHCSDHEVTTYFPYTLRYAADQSRG